MNDFFVGIKDAFNSRFGSIMYGTLILTWLTTNRKFWFVSFFINEKYILDKYGFLKSEYIVDLYSFHDFGSFIWILSKLILIPAAVTYLVHRQLYKIEKVVYAKGLSNKTERKIVRAKEDEKYQKIMGKVEKEKAEVLDIQEKNFEKEQKLSAKRVEVKEDVRDKEYVELDRKNIFKKAMFEIKKIVYDNNGYTYSSGNFHPDKDMIAYGDAHKICETPSDKNNQIRLTDKGRYFMAKYFDSSY